MQMKKSFFGFSAKIAMAVLAVCSFVLTSCYEKAPVPAGGFTDPSTYEVVGEVFSLDEQGQMVLLTGKNVRVTVDGMSADMNDATYSFKLSGYKSSVSVTAVADGYLAASRTLEIEEVLPYGMTSITNCDFVLKPVPQEPIVPEPERPATITVDPTFLNFAANSTEPQSVTMTLHNATEEGEWYIATNTDWFTFKIEGNILTVTPKAVNSSVESRYAVVTVKHTAVSEEYHPSVIITQYGAEPGEDPQPDPEATITVDPTSLTFAAASTEAQTVTMTLNNATEGTWSVDVNGEWFTCTVEGDILTVAPKSANTAEAARLGSITVKNDKVASDKYRTVVVCQEAAETDEPGTDPEPELPTFVLGTPVKDAVLSIEQVRAIYNLPATSSKGEEGLVEVFAHYALDSDLHANLHVNFGGHNVVHANGVTSEPYFVEDSLYVGYILNAEGVAEDNMKELKNAISYLEQINTICVGTEYSAYKNSFVKISTIINRNADATLAGYCVCRDFTLWSIPVTFGDETYTTYVLVSNATHITPITVDIHDNHDNHINHDNHGNQGNHDNHDNHNNHHNNHGNHGGATAWGGGAGDAE